MTEQTTWDDLMKSTNASLRELDIAYSRMMRTAAAIKAGTGRLADLEGQLNRLDCTTEEERRLAFMVAFLAGVKRGALIEYLFKVRRACLLLLLDGRGIATALGVEGSLVIEAAGEGRYRVTRAGEGAPRIAEGASRGAPRIAEGTSRGASRIAEGTPRGADDGERRRRHRGGRNRNRNRGNAPRTDSVTGKPAMDMSHFQEVLNNLEIELDAESSTSELEDFVKDPAEEAAVPQPDREPAAAAAAAPEPAAAAAEPAAATAPVPAVPVRPSYLEVVSRSAAPRAEVADVAQAAEYQKISLTSWADEVDDYDREKSRRHAARN